MASEAELRGRLRQAPGDLGAAVQLADLLMGAARAEEAHALMAPLAAAPGADIHVLTAAAGALKALGRHAEALPLYERALAVTPASAVAEHNLAGVLGDLHRSAESLAAADRALGKGLDAPETWLVKARALRGLGEFDAAEAAYREAARRRPDYADALGELAQLIWMLTADLPAASADLDAAIAAQPNSAAVRTKKAHLLEFAGEPAAAYAALAGAPTPVLELWPVQVQLAQLASGFDPAASLAHALRAKALLPGSPTVLLALCQAQLAAGEADAAAQSAEAALAAAPNDQHAIAFLTTAWRLLDDPRYGRLCDYEALVGAEEIETPRGWACLADYLRDLAGVLRGLHVYRTHPVGQSLRGGSQTDRSLVASDDPVIRSFFAAVEGPIRRYIARLGAGDDPLRRRIAGGYTVAGAWSARLQPNGFHVDHVHQKGWLSSACHIELPAAIEAGQAGWLKFGEPGVPTRPALPPERFIKPAPGRLVLFPSYFWHGTVPFAGQESRLSIAFDLLPD